ncbi:MAG TPA: thioredoxin domain-containing protein [Polyangia bacterium]|nr:thioredoxin domain-containing protein [Polyangia bacterium]
MCKGAWIAVAALAAACSKNSSDARAATGTTPAAQPTAAPAAAEDNTPPPGIDLSALDEFERKVFFRVLNKEPSACGKAHSLIHSLKNDPGCRKSVYAARYVVKLVDSGFTDSEVSEKLQKRFRGGPRKNIDIADAPMKGNPSGRVTLIEFVDYECPHCKRVQPVMRQAVDEFKNDLRVYFKHYPLPSHPNARLAAEAAVAAQKQGKFWPYNDGVWAHSEGLTPAVLEQIAKDVGLDVEKWRKDLDSDEVRQRVQKDRSDGEALSIQATPTIYLNGREYTDPRDIDSLRDWVNEELGK